jgi:hypothetical protein
MKKSTLRDKVEKILNSGPKGTGENPNKLSARIEKEKLGDDNITAKKAGASEAETMKKFDQMISKRRINTL